MKRFAVVAVLLSVVVAGCAGGGTTTMQPPATPCPAPATVDSQAKLVSPAPGATGVSPAIGSIAVAYSTNQVVIYGVRLTPGDGSAPVVADWTGTPPPPSGTAALTVPTLKSATTYTVTGSSVNIAHLACWAPVTANFGTFTTQ